MNVNIGIMTTERHLSNFKNIETELNKLCNFKYFIIKEMEDCKEFYLQNYNYVDAFVFSGPALYQKLIKEFKVLEKPSYTIYDDYANVYKQLLTIILNNPQIECSRIYIDFANEYNDFLGLRDVFPQDNMPYLIPWDSEHPEEVAKNVLNNHLQLWKENKIDLSITRFGHLTREFDKNNINYIFVIPSGKYIVDLISNAVTEIKLKKLNDNKTAVGYISLDNFSLYNYDNYEFDLSLLSLQKEVIKYCQNYSYDFIVQRRDSFIEVFTTIEDIYKITNNLNNCSLQTYLSQSLNSSISIGYGCGNNISQARVNALNSNKYARDHGGNCCFFIGEDQKVVGPIQKLNVLTYSQSPDPYILELSDKLEINNIYLQKIISFSKKIGTNKLSSEDVSECLAMAQRSANRVLNKLQEKDVAKITFEKRDSAKGRPKKYYELIFLDSNGNLKV